MISVIIPMYNEEKFIFNCLDSVVHQIGEKDEIIIVDDGSTDKSKNIVKDFIENNREKNIIYTYQENAGLGSACNTGLKLSKNEYVQFLDADDELSFKLLDKTKKILNESNVDIVIYDFLIQTVDGEIQKEHMELRNGRFSDHKSKSRLLNLPPSAKNKIFKKDIFLKNNIYFPESVWFEDLNTTLKLYLKSEDFYYLSNSYYKYIHRDNSIIHNPNLERNREILPVLKDVLDYYITENAFLLYEEELFELVVRHTLLHAPVRIIKNSNKYDSNLKKILEDIVLGYEKLEKEYFTRKSKKSLKGFTFKEKSLINLFKKRRFKIIYKILKGR